RPAYPGGSACQRLEHRAGAAHDLSLAFRQQGITGPFLSPAVRSAQMWMGGDAQGRTGGAWCGCIGRRLATELGTLLQPGRTGFQHTSCCAWPVALRCHTFSCRKYTTVLIAGSTTATAPPTSILPVIAQATPNAVMKCSTAKLAVFLIWVMVLFLCSLRRVPALDITVPQGVDNRNLLNSM